MEAPEVEREPEGLFTYRTAEIVVAAALLAFGVTFLVSSMRLGFRWGSDGPQSGFFPFYVSLAMCGGSAWTLGMALFKSTAKGRSAFVDLAALKRVLSVLVPAALYVLGIQLIGIYVSSAIYIVLFMRVIGKYSPVKSVLLGVAIAVAFFFMFEIWFQVPLYKGVWNPLSWTGY